MMSMNNHFSAFIPSSGVIPGEKAIGMTFFGSDLDILPLLKVFPCRIFNDITDYRAMRVLAWNLLFI